MFVEIKVLSCVSELRAIFLFITNVNFLYFSVEWSGGGYYFGGGVTRKPFDRIASRLGLRGVFLEYGIVRVDQRTSFRIYLQHVI